MTVREIWCRLLGRVDLKKKSGYSVETLNTNLIYDDGILIGITDPYGQGYIYNITYTNDSIIMSFEGGQDYYTCVLNEDGLPDKILDFGDDALFPIYDRNNNIIEFKGKGYYCNNNIRYSGKVSYDDNKYPYKDFPLPYKIYVLLSVGPNNPVHQDYPGCSYIDDLEINSSYSYDKEGYPIIRIKLKIDDKQMAQTDTTYFFYEKY